MTRAIGISNDRLTLDLRLSYGLPFAKDLIQSEYIAELGHPCDLGSLCLLALHVPPYLLQAQSSNTSEMDTQPTMGR